MAAPTLAASSLLLTLPLVQGATQGEATRAVYAVIPMRNLTAAVQAGPDLMDLLRGVLEARGAWFAPAEDVERALRAQRIRYTDSVSREDAAALGELVGARYLMVGTVLDYAAVPEPRIAVALRVLDVTSGRRVQSSLVSLSGSDFRGMLGIGGIEELYELQAEVVARIAEDFDDDGAPLAWRLERKLTSQRASDPLTYFVHEDFDPSGIESVAVMPLVNRTNRPEAGVIFSELLSHEWFRAAGVDVVELSELRASMIRKAVRSLDYLDEGLLAEIGEDVGARYFVLGGIDRFSERIRADGRVFPEVEVSIRLLDVSQAQIVAGTSLLRSGDHYHVLLGLGNEDDLVVLADRVARELIALIAS